MGKCIFTQILKSLLLLPYKLSSEVTVAHRSEWCWCYLTTNFSCLTWDKALHHLGLQLFTWLVLSWHKSPSVQTFNYKYIHLQTAVTAVHFAKWTLVSPAYCIQWLTIKHNHSQSVQTQLTPCKISEGFTFSLIADSTSEAGHTNQYS